MTGLSVEKARRLVAAYGKKMAAAQLVPGTWGNLSCLVPKEKLLVITPSGVDYAHIRPDMTVVVDMQGEVVQGDLKPSSELKVHLAIYRGRADVQAVVHTHSIYACALAVARSALPPILEDMAALVGGGVPVAEYALAGTEQLAINTLKALGTGNAVLMANHGLVGVGRTLEEALAVCEMVERCAQIYLLAKQAGSPAALSEQDVNSLRDFYVHKYGQKKE